MDKNFEKFQHSALLFGQRLNFFKYLVFGFGRMKKCTFSYSLRLPDTEQCLLNLFRPKLDPTRDLLNLTFYLVGYQSTVLPIQT